MNEDQKCNDYKLHIEPCICGNPSPQLMGDDFDADVGCDKCGRETPVCFGTKNAIANWNHGIKNKTILPTKERPLVYYVVVEKEKQALFEEFIRKNHNGNDMYIDQCTTFYK